MRTAIRMAIFLTIAAIACKGSKEGKRPAPPAPAKPAPCPQPGEVRAGDPKCKFVPPTPEESAKHYAKQYSFSSDWFTPNVPEWSAALAHLKGKPDVSYLEVGLYEGRSAIWMLENVLTHPTARLTGIDVFPDNLEERWLANLEQSGAAGKTTTIKGFSQAELRKLPLDSFDAIYIDGSHTADDVLADAVLSWDLLKSGGILIFDDYEWREGTHLPEELRPHAAIDAFITAYRNEIEVVHRCYQVILKKIANPCSPKFHCTPIGQYLYRWKDRHLVTRDNQPVPLQQGEQRLIEKLARSRRFGRTEFDLSALAEDPAFASMRERLQLEL